MAADPTDDRTVAPRPPDSDRPDAPGGGSGDPGDPTAPGEPAVDGGSAPGGGSGPRHRVRDLSAGGRVVALVAAVLLLVPIGASLLRAVDEGWVPSNDDALIVLRSFDVLGEDRPLVGQPSTAGQYAEDHPARHPGPIEFYMLAGPVRIFGPTWGTLLTVAFITGSAVLLTAWAAFRRAGPVVGLGAAVLLGFVMWSTGSAVLTDPISSNVGGYPLMAGAALAWALWGDDRRLWPVAMAVWSFTTQQHLAVLGPAGVIAAWGVLGAVIATVRHRHEVGRVASSLRWGVAAVVVGFVCWLPPLIDQVFGDGNLAYILGFSGSEGRDTLGFRAGLRAAGRAVGVPPWFFQRDRDGGHLIDPYLSTGTAVAAVVGVAVLVTCAVLAAIALLRHRRRPTPDAVAAAGPDAPAADAAAPDAVASAGSAGQAAARLTLALTGLVLLVAGVITTANVPDSHEQVRINFYRWTWPVAVALWGSVAWAVGAGLTALRTRTASATPTVPRWAAVGAPVVALAVVSATVTAAAVGDGRNDQRRDELLFRFEASTADTIIDMVDPDRPVHLVTRGSAAFLALSPALTVALEDAGLDVRLESTFAGSVDDAQREGYGPHRLELADDPGARIHVVTGTDDLPEVPGETVAELALGREADRLAAELAEQLRAGPIVVSDRADELVGRYEGERRALVELGLLQLETDPESAVRSTVTLDLLADGYLESPTVDPDLVAAMDRTLRRGTEVWGDDRFHITVEILP